MDIKPCPYCGSGDIRVNNHGVKVFIYCRKCELMTGLGKLDMVVKKWNGMSDAVKWYDDSISI